MDRNASVIWSPLPLDAPSLPPAARGSLVLGGAESCRYGVRLSVGAHWERDPLVLTGDGRLLGHGLGADASVAASAMRDRLTLHFGLAATVLALDDGPSLEVSLRAPMVAWQRS